MKQLIKFFKDKPIKKVLDVGTGTGDFMVVLKKVFPEAEIIGVDPNPDSLEIAKEKFPEISFKQISAENIKFATNTFDVVSISMALHHLANIKKSFDEMKRVAKTGGWIVVAELFSDNLNQAQEVHKMYHHFRSKIDRLNGISHNKTFRKDEILKMVSDSGIEILNHFEIKKEQNLVENPAELESRVDKMEIMLESVKNFAEYDLLKSQIAEFRAKAVKYGFQPATRVVVLGEVN